MYVLSVLDSDKISYCVVCHAGGEEEDEDEDEEQAVAYARIMNEMADEGLLFGHEGGRRCRWSSDGIVASSVRNEIIGLYAVCRCVCGRLVLFSWVVLWGLRRT